MTNIKQIQTILNGTISSLKTVIPIPMDIQQPSPSQQSFQQSEMGVLIGIVGDMKGQIIIDSTSATFSSISHHMFGISLEGEMLESFTGELGNMIVGNLCTFASIEEMEIDITPPTVLVGNTKLSGFHQAIKLPVQLMDIGKMTIILTIYET